MKKLHFKKTAIRSFILFSLFFAVFGMGALYYFHLKEVQLQDSRYNITTIRQIGKNKGILPSNYLAELLGFRSDRPVNLIAFDSALGEKKLLASAIIKTADIRKILPQTIEVEYTLRTPFFRLVNYNQAGIDEEGVIFPLIIEDNESEVVDLKLGNLPDEIEWGIKVEPSLFNLALYIAVEAGSLKESMQLKTIDLTRAREESEGQREIILLISEKNRSHDWQLKMDLKNFRLQLHNFAILRHYLLNNDLKELPKSIDLRISRLAFID